MRALTVQPGDPSSLLLENRDAPRHEPGAVLVETILLGICGTDAHVIHRRPPERGRIVLGHESLGRVVATADPVRTPAVGDLVVGIVRRPCPPPCSACAQGALEWCTTDPPVECGISGADGYAADRWTSEPDYLCAIPASLGELGVLVEPASSIVRGLGRVGADQAWGSGDALVLGAGTMGLLTAALLGEAGWSVRVHDPGAAAPRRRLVRAVGAEYGEPRQSHDLVVEASGGHDAIGTGATALGRSGRMLVLGLASRPAALPNPSELVMSNAEIVFSVNASAEDYSAAAQRLAELDGDALQSIVGRELPAEQFAEALEPDASIAKTVLRFGR